MSGINKAVEAAARAICRSAGNPENIKAKVKPMRQDYLPDAKTAPDVALPHLHDD
ncbi:MAG TPA: hypothetical protein VF463_00900 [Sphingobium sp.]